MFQELTTQNTTVTSGGRTGEICQKTGPYRCSTSPVVVVPIKKGTPYPLAPKSGSTTGQASTWTLVTISTSTITTI
jgi:hypothetical protein